MRKISLALSVFLLTACQQLQHGQMQPVKLVDIKQQIYKTTCSGLAEAWPQCLEKAKETCVNGYNTIERVQTPVGAKRELTFQCKK